VVPRENTGDVPQPLFTPCSSHQYGEMIHADEASQITFIDRYLEERLDPDYWWMDAGWYPNETGWPNTGTWEVDPKRFPRGFRPITDHAHERGLRTILWFEPERVTPGTWLYTTHPEWLLSHPGDPDGQKLLDLGNPEARRWLTDHVDGILTREGIDLYRQDFNMEALPFWRGNDAPDRQGITENHHVTGLLAYWDELRRRHPGMLIDTCASGGRRNDIDMLSRAVPFLRSDFIFEPTAQQAHTYGAAMWIPYFGTGSKAEDEYTIRSSMALNIIGCWDLRREDLDYNLLRRLITEWRDWSVLMLGDFYPLTEYHLETDVWMAWQFDRPDLGRGMVQVFRRQDSPYERAVFPLHALNEKTRYRVRDLNTDDTREVSGGELLRGLTVEIAERPAARIILYETA
jgi:alpha-galactosidase